MSFPADTSLVRATRGNAGEVDHMARLDSEVVLPCSLWRKIGSSVGLCPPKVPDGDIGQVVAGDCNSGLAGVLEDDGLVDGDRCVDSVGLVGDGDCVGCLGDDLIILSFVLVGASLKARDGRGGDVLETTIISNTIPCHWNPRHRTGSVELLTGRDM